MKIQSYKPPQSSFLSIEKDLSIIVEQMLKNNRLKKYLYYTVRDPLAQPNLTDEQTYELFGNNIKIIPKKKIDETVMNQVIITFDSFLTNETNPQFRDNFIEFAIVCHADQWHLKDFALRPYRIAAEIDTMLQQVKLTGIGQLLLVDGGNIIFNDEFSGVAIKYYVIHSGEDRVGMLNPADEEQFIKDFNEMFNDDED